LSTSLKLMPTALTAISTHPGCALPSSIASGTKFLQTKG
jgi:hypothetical protein